MRAQNLSYDKLPTWMHGRGWAGKWSAEWGVLQKFYPGIEFGKNYEKIGGYISLGFIYLFLHYKRYKDCKNRKIGFYWNEGCFWIKPWINDDYSDYNKKWYQKIIILHVVDRLLGRSIYSNVNGECTNILVPMPEGSYKGKATKYTSTWKRKRWPIAKTIEGYDIELEKCIPFQGKGENSWDQGDDGVWSIHCKGELEECIGQLVASALKSRRRHGETSATQGRVVYAY